MSASTYDAAGETDAGAEPQTDAAIPERRVISDKAISEMDQLHREVLATKPPKPWSPIAMRRRHHDARVAERDFLRALGFEDWDAFEALVHPESEAAPEPDVAPEVCSETVVDLVAAEMAELAPAVPRRGPDESPLDLTDIAELIRVVLHELADSRADLNALQASSTRVDELLDRALMEIVALRLELMVAERRRAVG